MRHVKLIAAVAIIGGAILLSWIGDKQPSKPKDGRTNAICGSCGSAFWASWGAKTHCPDCGAYMDARRAKKEHGPEYFKPFAEPIPLPPKAAEPSDFDPTMFLAVGGIIALLVVARIVRRKRK